MTKANSNGLCAVTVRDLEALEPHLAAWDALAWQAQQQVASLLPACIEASLRHRLGLNERWMCCFAYTGERLVGVLSVIIVPHPVFGERWQRLRTFAQKNHTGDIVLAQDCAAKALQALLVEVHRQVPTHLSRREGSAA